MSLTARQLETQSRLPHRLAVLLACATFPLIWVGGLVTTYDAGMAVPDWPTTYGYNLFLYPWQTWLFGPWDLFIEHGHRLLGAVVGMLTIALAVALWARDGRRWLRWLGLAAIAGVVSQGVLGGLRVRLDARLLAQIHGCVGPAFFALSAALAVFTSGRWFAAGTRPLAVRAGAFRLPFAATNTAVLAYVQLLLGSQLRHMPVTADATMFRLAVFFHLVVAAALAAHVFLTWYRAEREAAGNAWLVRPARGLAGLIAAQLALGAGAWVVNYGWPAWLSSFGWAAGFVVRREGFGQAIVTTGHVAVGSLILATAVVLALRSWKVAAELSALRGTEAVSRKTSNTNQLVHEVVVA
ncbi:MAG TPA: cytochrome oxidase assembly protein [Pirellulales bacterium]|nr:cytochrome oxidase assembly protein [Pirellulales bacterium]